MVATRTKVPVMHIGKTGIDHLRIDLGNNADHIALVDRFDERNRTLTPHREGDHRPREQDTRSQREKRKRGRWGRLRRRAS